MLHWNLLFLESSRLAVSFRNQFRKRQPVDAIPISTKLLISVWVSGRDCQNSANGGQNLQAVQLGEGADTLADACALPFQGDCWAWAGFGRGGPATRIPRRGESWRVGWAWTKRYRCAPKSYARKSDSDH